MMNELNATLIALRIIIVKNQNVKTLSFKILLVVYILFLVTGFLPASNQCNDQYQQNKKLNICHD
jgi:hypothetical protein